MIRFLVAALTLALGGAASAQDGPLRQETLEIGTSTNQIAITSDFSGADLTVFGAINDADPMLLSRGDYDIVVLLEGPKAEADVRRKERVFGIWVNRQTVTFEHVPRSYSISSTRPLSDIASPQALSSEGLGVDHLRISPVGYFDASDLATFRAAMLRLNATDELYEYEPDGVKFVSNSLFRASLRLSVNIPQGIHTVQAYLFKKGQLVDRRALPLNVVKTGFEAQITTAAHEYALFYGLAAVCIALMSGWLASVIFRKN
ncbi:TIGR02186 family protein [Martelella endophytica]|uniref:Membrane protein n=1 Tax=Martelella endophytica TaxID=1486262 RepID=A0A0D5LKP4_MAREN|nr:TIGR02186 family protein [Martelella endophytica]AJY44515.1 membrane protein [Martelella endophytica]